MRRIVAHFIRKESQLKASFIQNQITNHIQFQPIIIYRYKSKKNDGGFAEFSLNDTPTLDLSEGKLFDINFRYLKKISAQDGDKVKYFLKKNNAAVLHFHYGSDTCIYTDVLKNSGIPSVVSFYGYDASSFNSFLFGYGGYLLRNRLFPLVDKVFAMSPDMKKDLIKAGCPEAKIIIHYYGTDVNLFKDLTPVYTRKEKITLLILASLVPQKGHLFLLKAFVQLVNNGCNNIILRIVGSGELENQLKNFVNRNSLQNYVKFIGACKYGSQEMLNELQNADIFVHPSVIAENGDKEGIPGTIVEAMSAGLPVISTYHAGIPFIIKNNESGLLISEGHTNALADAIKKLATNINLRAKLGQNARRFALENLDLLTKEKELENIYDSFNKLSQTNR